MTKRDVFQHLGMAFLILTLGVPLIFSIDFLRFSLHYSTYNDNAKAGTWTNATIEQVEACVQEMLFDEKGKVLSINPFYFYISEEYKFSSYRIVWKNVYLVLSFSDYQYYIKNVLAKINKDYLTNNKAVDFPK
jgi:hypothetical protein